MNEVEKLLSDTADYFQSRLGEDRVLREHLRALLEQGRRPRMVRVLGPEMPDDCLALAVERVSG